MEAAYVAVLIVTLVGMGALSFYFATKLFAGQR
jgi:hypothetical protein